MYFQYFHAEAVWMRTFRLKQCKNTHGQSQQKEQAGKVIWSRLKLDAAAPWTQAHERGQYKKGRGDEARGEQLLRERMHSPEAMSTMRSQHEVNESPEPSLI